MADKPSKRRPLTETWNDHVWEWDVCNGIPDDPTAQELVDEQKAIDDLREYAKTAEPGTELKAARICAERWAAAGKRVVIIGPLIPGTDSADMAELRAKRKEADDAN